MYETVARRMAGNGKRKWDYHKSKTDIAVRTCLYLSVLICPSIRTQGNESPSIHEDAG